jgi:hypothetical protein
VRTAPLAIAAVLLVAILALATPQARPAAQRESGSSEAQPALGSFSVVGLYACPSGSAYTSGSCQPNGGVGWDVYTGSFMVLLMGVAETTTSSPPMVLTHVGSATVAANAAPQLFPQTYCQKRVGAYNYSAGIEVLNVTHTGSFLPTLTNENGAYFTELEVAVVNSTAGLLNLYQANNTCAETSTTGPSLSSVGIPTATAGIAFDTIIALSLGEATDFFGVRSPSVLMQPVYHPQSSWGQEGAYNLTQTSGTSVFSFGSITNGASSATYMPVADSFIGSTAYNCAVSAPGHLGTQVVENGTTYAYVNVSYGTAPYQYTVNWGDGSNTTVIDTSATYVHPSHFFGTDVQVADEIAVQVADVTPAETNCYANLTLYPALKVTWTTSPASPTSNATVYLNATLRGGDPTGATFAWSFVPARYALGGTPAGHAHTSVIFDASGKFRGFLNVTDGGGYSYEARGNVTVAAGGGGGSGLPPCTNCGGGGISFLGISTTDLALAAVVIVVVFAVAAYAARKTER